MQMPTQDELLSFKTTLPYMDKSYPETLYTEVIFSDSVVQLFRDIQDIYTEEVLSGKVNIGNISLFRSKEFARTLNFVQAAIYHNNKIKGWHEPKRELGTMLFLIVTELAETMEEFRNGRPAIYQFQGERVVEYGDVHWNSLLKPEGTATGMADAVIRLFDTCGAQGYELSEPLSRMDRFINHDLLEQKEMGSQLMSLAFWMGVFHFEENEKDKRQSLNGMAINSLLFLIQFCAMNDLDLGLALQVKDRFNKTRAHRHGGKLC